METQELKAEDYSKTFSAPTLHCEEYGHMRTWNTHKGGKTLYIGIEAI